MARQTAFALLVAATLSLSGCMVSGVISHNPITNNPWTDHPDLGGIRTVSINPVISRGKFWYQGSKDASDPGSAKAVLALMDKNGIEIEEIVRQEFIGQLQRSGPFTVVEAHGDAEITLAVTDWSLKVRNGSYSTLWPGIRISATLSDSKSKAVLSTEAAEFFPAGILSKMPHTWEEYEANPELLRQGFQSVVAVVAKKIAAGFNHD